MNVAEAAFLPDGSLIVSATENGAAVQLYRVSVSGRIDPLGAGEARYPAVSRDGHWLAFSKFAGGNWNLYLRDLQTGATHRLTDAPCGGGQIDWRRNSANPVDQIRLTLFASQFQGHIAAEREADQKDRQVIFFGL